MVDIIYKPISAANYSPASYRKATNKIVWHWIVGTIDSAYTTFSNPSRGASATFAIGPDVIYRFISDGACSWANSNWDYNSTSLTFEMQGGPSMPFDEKVFENACQLTAAKMKEYGMGKAVHGGNLFQHKEVPGANTQCAGYYGAQLDRAAKRINEILGGEVDVPQNVVNNTKDGINVGQTVTFDYLWTQSNGGQRLKALVNAGVVTRYIPGADHPYLIGNGTGWVSASDVKGGQVSQPSNEPGVGSTVTFDYLWTQSNGGDRLRALVHSGVITKVIDAEHGYLVGNGVGWLSKGDMTNFSGGGSTPAPSTDIKVGDSVVVTSPVDYNGTHLGVSGTYTVMEVKGDRVVIGRGGAVTAAMNKANLRKA